MATITATMVKELRVRTGVGMMDCKKALVASDGDMELAIDDLRKSSGMKAAKKAGRIAADGLIGVKVADGKGVMKTRYIPVDFKELLVDHAVCAAAQYKKGRVSKAFRQACKVAELWIPYNKCLHSNRRSWIVRDFGEFDLVLASVVFKDKVQQLIKIYKYDMPELVEVNNGEV
jgi:hypothetical protein